MKKKRVLFVIPSPVSFKIFLSELVDALHEERYEITVVCNKYERDCYLEDVHYEFLDFPRNMNIRKYYIATKQLKEIIKTFQPDIIHAHFSTAAILTYLSRFAEFPYSIATIQGVIYTVQSSFVTKLKYMVPELLAYRFFNETFVLTEDDYIKLKRFVPKLSKQYAPGFGCNTFRFNPEVVKSKGINLRAQLGISPNAKVLIYIGRLVKFKGFDIALKAFLKAKEKIPELVFIICGNFDPIHPAGLTSDEKELIHEKNGIIWKGFVDNVEEYLSISDLNIFPSTREGMPVNLMESIAMGVPVITSNSRGCRHVVENYFTGRIIQEQAYQSYAGVIVEMLRNSAELATYKKNCIAMRAYFNRTRFIEETLRLYHESGGPQNPIEVKDKPNIHKLL